MEICWPTISVSDLREARARQNRWIFEKFRRGNVMKIYPEKCQYRRRTTHMYVGRFAQDDDILDKIPINIFVSW